MHPLPCLEHTPAGPVRASVIWLHGLGANGYDFAPLVPVFGMPDVRFVFPHAPDAPVTINGGYVMPSWYDIRSLDHERKDREDPDGVRASAEKVRALIAREVERGVPEERIVLAGFSQGAAMALYVAARHPRPLAGVVVLSGYLVLEDTLDAEATDAGRRATALFAHGTRDDVVPIAGGREACARMRALGASVAWHEFPIGHDVSSEEVQVIRAFLRTRTGTP